MGFQRKTETFDAMKIVSYKKTNGSAMKMGLSNSTSKK